jgi:hypothetical protein
MLSLEDVKGTHLADPKVRAAWAGMVGDATPGYGVASYPTKVVDGKILVAVA